MDKLVEFLDGDVVKVHTDSLRMMKDIATDNECKKRFRLCLHESPDNDLHEMLICRTKHDYVKPDKHVGISESHTIIEGTEMIVLFEDDGRICDAFLLDREKGFISYRINSPVFHMTIPITEMSIDYEVKPGPFTSESNIYPSWAPDESNLEAVAFFLRKVEDDAKEFLQKGIRNERS